MVLYELHYTKDGKAHELMLTPDARPYHEPHAQDEHEGDEDD